MPKTLLLLGGSAEAATLADTIIDRFPEVSLISSLAGRTRRPRPLPGHIRVGGFGGAEGLADYLRTEPVDLLIDATHPHAKRISENAAAAAKAAGVKRVALIRPEWGAPEGADWREVEDLEEAAEKLKETEGTVFLATGRSKLEPFAAIADRDFLVRTIDPPEGPLPIQRVKVVTGLPTGDVAEERALMERHGVGVVVAKNSGAAVSLAKLEAARDLGLPILVVRRPEPPPGEKVGTVDEMIAWLEEFL